MIQTLARTLCLLLALSAGVSHAAPLSGEALAPLIVPPYALGAPLNDQGVWQLLNSGGAEAGYVFETEPLAPLPGFSGAPINMLVMLDLDGRFLDVRLIGHNEPIFVSGLGEAPLRKFLEQYRGLSITSPMAVGVPYGAGAGSEITYLDGVTKATASVRIAHESIMGATLAVAREKMKGLHRPPPGRPDPNHAEPLDWPALMAQGIARNLRVTNAEVDAAFAGTIWAEDDPQPDPDGLYLDLWLVDIGPPAIARAVLTPESLSDLDRFRAVSPHDEPLLVIDAGRHGLVSEAFVRNTAPDLLGAAQDGLPVALRDADLLFETLPGVPTGTAMILRADRRLGFDPARDWQLRVIAERRHGMFQPETGSHAFPLTHATPERFFLRPEAATAPLPPWAEALRNRAADLIVLSVGLTALFLALGPGMTRLAGFKLYRPLPFAAQNEGKLSTPLPFAPSQGGNLYTPLRFTLLAGMTGFVGFWGQGQLSIVTPLATLRTVLEGGSLAYLLYDPFSLMVWIAAIAGFFLWGRGLFCGWLCPFGALQEFAHHLGRALRLPRWEPSVRADNSLKYLKYILLSGLVAVVFLAPDQIDTMAEIEPFKTAITTHFQREWVFVVYALAWLILGLFTFKGFCRYVCPLGALMAIGGLLRGRDWISRRKECGSPCQLCKVRCAYGAIKPSGKIAYSECFQCLDCVTIHDDPTQCVPLILAARGKGLRKEAP